MQREEGNALDGEQAERFAAEAGERRDDHVAARLVAAAEGAGDVRQPAGLQRVRDERIVARQAAVGAGLAERGERLRCDAVRRRRIERRGLQLAVLGEQAEQGFGAGQRAGLAGDLLQRAERVAHRHRAADQVLFETVVRQAQQVVLVGQVFEALIEVDLHALGAARARQPQAGELAGEHDQDQAAEEVLLGEFARQPARRGEDEPGEQQHRRAGQSGEGAVAHGQDDRREPRPGKAGVRPQRVERIDPDAEADGEQRQQERLGGDRPGVAEGREIAELREFQVTNPGGAQFWRAARPAPINLRISCWATAESASRLQPLLPPAPLHSVSPLATSTIESAMPTAGSPSTPTL